MRHDGRTPDQLRPVNLTTGFVDAPLGSVLIDWGRTKVNCTASLTERVPPFLYRSGKGWVTAEYSMLPGSTAPRARRDAAIGKVSGRTQEIQRLIARSLRQAVDLKAMGERQIVVDCDVLQADGGTRTAATTGGWVALEMALRRLIRDGVVPAATSVAQIAAVSVGIVDGRPVADLDYVEDSQCAVDANFVFSRNHGLVEVQGTGEKAAFSRAELNAMLDLAEQAASQLFDLQLQALAGTD